MKKTNNLSVGDTYGLFLRLKAESLKPKANDELKLISFLKKLWNGYQDRKKYRKEVQRRLLRQRALKREKASTPLSLTGEHWTDRFLKRSVVQPPSTLPMKNRDKLLSLLEEHWTDRYLKKLKAFVFYSKVPFITGRLPQPLSHQRKASGFARLKGGQAMTGKVGMTLVLICSAFALKAQDTIRPLNVGDNLPEITIEQVSNYTDNTLKLSDFKGKLVILDFWASWCSPCVALIPKMEKLQQEFEGKVSFITIAYEGAKEVEKFNQQLLKRGIQNRLIQVVGDVKMGLYFPHTYLPHEVWISPKGKVMAITTEEAITSEKIQEALNQQLRVATKIDKRIPHDSNEPLFIKNNGGDGESLIYHRTFSGFVDGLRSRSSAWVKPDGSTQITATNTSYISLCQLAYSGNGIAFSSRNRLAVELKDSSELIAPNDKESFVKWEKQNRFCYEFWAPPLFKEVVFDDMKRDLKILFPKYIAQIEKRATPVWVLKRTSTRDKLASKGGAYSSTSSMVHFEIHNAAITQLSGMLDIKYLSLQPFPVLNETGYTGKVDLLLDANMSNVASINEALKVYDLTLEKAIRTIDILVIKDNPNYRSQNP